MMKRTMAKRKRKIGAKTTTAGRCIPRFGFDSLRTLFAAPFRDVAVVVVVVLGSMVVAWSLADVERLRRKKRFRY